MPRYMITPDREQSGEGFGACWDFDSPFTVIADGDGPMEAVLSAESKDYCPWADDGLDPNVDGGQELDGRLELAEDWSDWGHEFGLVPMIRFGQLEPALGLGPPIDVHSVGRGQERNMTVEELIRELKRFDQGCEVRFVHQSNYPLVSSIYGVVSQADIDEAKNDVKMQADEFEGDCEDEDEEDDEEDDDEEDGVVFIVEGDYMGYGSRVAWEIV